MNRIIFPENIKELIFTLEAAGHKAYAVGGAVRDALLGLSPHDWDIACSALPEEVLELFGDRAAATGLKHGTVTVKTGGEGVEVTTFRSDGAYLDHRRPETVSFVSSIEGDLKRRDFTMNAIAARASGEIIDPFGGLGDIENRLIRCVGDASVRFSEDALRMFRAIRFKAKLGFEIEDLTMAAIFENAKLAGELASERIFTELDRTLVCEDMSAVSIMLTTPLLAFLGIEPRHADFSSLGALPCDRLCRWIGFCHSVFADRHASDLFLYRLRADNEVRALVRNSFDIMSTMPEDNISWKRLLAVYGDSVCKRASCVMSTDSQKLLEEVFSSGDCYKLADLAVSGRDLKALGLEGKEIGRMLKRLLDHVIVRPDFNTREKLLEMANKTPEF